MNGYHALHQGAAWLDLTGRVHLRVGGQDRVRWLHAMCSNHIQQLRPGEGCYAFFLNAQGRILADANVLCLQECFLLDLEPETRGRMLDHLERHIIADDVTLEDRTEVTAVLGVEGPQAEAIMAALGAPIPGAPGSHLAWRECRVARLTATGAAGFRIFAPRESHRELLQALEQAGAVSATADEVRIVRLEQGRPRYGEDVTDKHLPQETQLLHAIHFQKGCYLGQEIVERIRSQGNVHRRLVPLRIAAQQAPDPGAPIVAGEQRVGEVSSAAWSPKFGEVVALGYVRPAEIPAGVELHVAGQRARIAGAGPLCVH